MAVIETMSAAALFIFIGAKPYTDFVGDVVERNRSGFVLTGNDLAKDGRRAKNWQLKRDPFLLETNVPGIFAVGDVRQVYAPCRFCCWSRVNGRFLRPSIFKDRLGQQFCNNCVIPLLRQPSFKAKTAVSQLNLTNNIV